MSLADRLYQFFFRKVIRIGSCTEFGPSDIDRVGTGLQSCLKSGIGTGR